MHAAPTCKASDVKKGDACSKQGHVSTCMQASDPCMQPDPWRAMDTGGPVHKNGARAPNSNFWFLKKIYLLSCRYRVTGCHSSFMLVSPLDGHPEKMNRRRLNDRDRVPCQTLDPQHSAVLPLLSLSIVRTRLSILTRRASMLDLGLKHLNQNKPFVF